MIENQVDFSLCYFLRFLFFYDFLGVSTFKNVTLKR